MRKILIFGLLALISFSSINAQTEWWQTMTLYQIYPRSWMDSDGDGVGDLPGIESKLQHLVDAGIDAFWISPIYPSPMADFGYDISNFVDIEPVFGTLDDFDNLVATAKSLGLKVILDFVPNHSSDQHEWFVKSLAAEDPYTDYYIWHNGTTSDTGIRSPPNNWVSVFGGSAWTWRSERQAYYLHQFAAEQPDLNFRNQYVVQEMKDVLTFWMNRGVDGFRMDAIPFLFEDPDFPDEPLSGTTNVTTEYGYTLTHYTQSLDETYEMVTQWRAVLDNFTSSTDNIPRIMMIEAYANTSFVMKYYDAGAHFPFNFELISNVDGSSSAAEIKSAIDDWLENIPDGATSDWVIGNHDNSRVASRYTTEHIDSMNIMNLLLPGVSVTYYGEEIGMEDQWISWEDTQDPNGCGGDETTYESLSRDPERTPMQWDATTSAGFSTNTSTWLPVHDNYETVNLAAQVAADVSHYKVFQALTTLRKETVIQEGSVNVQLLNDNVLAFSRVLTGSDPVVVVINLANSTETVSLNTFEAASDDLEVSIASIHSSLTTGSKVSKSSLELSAYAAVVLRSSIDTDSTTEAGTESNTEAGTESNTEAGTESNTEAGTESNTEAGTESNTEAGTESNTEAGTESNTEAGTESNTESGTESTTEAGTESNTESGTESNTESGTESNTEAGTESTTEAGTESNTEAGTESNTEAGTESNTEAGTESNTEAGTESNTEAGTESNTEAGTESNTEAGTESNTEAGTESNTEAGTESNTESGNESNTEPGNESNTEPGNESNTESGNDSNNGATTAPDDNTDSGANAQTSSIIGTLFIAILVNVRHW